jgi:Cof subfamily protein (haloacid dehalogenase superfamily)
LNIQLVVADIDGTFLNSAGLPSTGALEAVARLREHGIAFTLCSGRPDPGVRGFVEMLALDVPYMVSGGTAVNHPRDHQTVFQSQLTTAQVQAALELGLSTGSNIILHTPKSISALCDEIFWQTVCVGRWISTHGWQDVNRVPSAAAALALPVIHINYFNQEDRLVSLGRQVENLPHDLQTCIIFSKLEIIDRQAGKGHALKFLADYLQIPIENTLAIGDGLNDISMLQTAGIGVAMENSPLELIWSAGYVAPANDAGGFAFTIEQVLSGSLDSLRKTS